jgi:hypothetical protein
MGMNVRIHIAKLTLEGATRADAARAGHALRARLASLVGRGIDPVAGHVSRIDAGEIPAGSMDRAGRRAAERIFAQLKGGRRG